MPWPFWRRAGALIPLLALILAPLLAGCGGSSSSDAPPPPPIVLQKMTVRVLDTEDQPIVGARMNIFPLHGQPTRPQPFFSDQAGDIQLTWMAEVRTAKASEHSRDKVYYMRSAFDFVVHAATYLPHYGGIDLKDSSRVVSSLALKTPNDPSAVLQPHSRVEILHHPEQLFAGDLAEMSPRDPVVAVCLAFYADNRAVFDILGAKFDWPTYLRTGDTMRMRFVWKGAIWGGLGPAPLSAQVAMATGVPILLAIGEDVLPITGIEKIALEFVVKVAPKDDPHGAPERTIIRIVAPSQQVIALAMGKVTPGQFLAKHHPKVYQGQELKKLEAMAEMF